MEEKEMTGSGSPNQDKTSDCGCDGNCCPPKKKNPLKKILFAVIILAALGILAFKLTHKPPPETAKKACCPSGSSASCDTTKKSGCDTTKNSSCCPKK
ncbi:MAG: hypothetical protein NTU51_03755 [Bacteroidetes bacterium]|nr:hypothetical protein [Bacteroidota bacterium]